MGNAAHRAHVLLIEDHEVILGLFQRVFETEGYHVTISTEPLEAASVVALAPDVIVLELLASGGADLGWEYLTEIQRNPAIARIPVVLCTTASWTVLHPTMAAELDRMGVRVVIKPSELTDLVTAVTEALTEGAS